ncbi:hypothetical protein H735_30120 [Vibrio owensii CAIM 1854 = LMG 25443]|uniref:Uncharacterized protein n=1 Tax=Vibrio owensii CAIM 1854 = LMG 25443 TaxID=1229493 RepID=A0A0C1V5C8_9VIBR|nr:hypothetical protein H735_30120 [Vibrio owensii CAIM 1854 = LMG 25443]
MNLDWYIFISYLLDKKDKHMPPFDNLAKKMNSYTQPKFLIIYLKFFNSLTTIRSNKILIILH